MGRNNDALSRRTSVDNLFVNYSYDTIDQLTQEASIEAQPQINTGYSYDAMGNRSSAQASGTYTGSYSNSYTPNKLNQILSHATTSNGTTNTRNLSYDLGGNLTRQTLSTVSNNRQRFARCGQIT